jgi:hypothetical protein
MAAEERGGGTPPKMTRAEDGRKVSAPDEAPRTYTLRPIGGLLARVTRAGFRRRAPAGAQIMMDWVEIMGPMLGSRTHPQKLSAGTLTIACQGPVAMELQHLAPQLIARLNSHIGTYGENALIKRLRFVQQAAPVSILAPPRPARAAPTGPSRAAPPPDLPGIDPGPLRDALERLGQAVRRHRGKGE